jgi:hypothetical protein
MAADILTATRECGCWNILPWSRDFSGVLPRVISWLGTNVSEAGFPPSSGLSFVIMDMYSLHCCLSREVLDSRNSLGRQQCSGYVCMITNLNSEDGGRTASETLVSNHITTRSNNPENLELCSLRACRNSCRAFCNSEVIQQHCFSCICYTASNEDEHEWRVSKGLELGKKIRKRAKISN